MKLLEDKNSELVYNLKLATERIKNLEERNKKLAQNRVLGDKNAMSIQQE